MVTFSFNYFNSISELCKIGKKYHTDKSSLRKNIKNKIHCHGYTLFYDDLFKNFRDKKLNIAEFGISGSLYMWRDYFTNSNIFGFDNNKVRINKYKQRNNNRITITNLNVLNKSNVIKTFKELNILYDIIIYDVTSVFEDQVKFIEYIYKFLKPGGILIIEDIAESSKESKYIDKLKSILNHFQNYYFIELEHQNKKFKNINNDKLFILIKGDGEFIFKNINKLTLITPSYRTNNLFQLEKSIDFNYIDEWIIVYDGSKINNNPKLFDNPKIKEFVYEGEGISGNPQRNYALTKITNFNTSLYYLDDDNIIHPNLYKLLNLVDNKKMYTFNNKNIKGNNIEINKIDTAMTIIPFSMCKSIIWILDKYNADGYYIKECYDQDTQKHVFVDNILCYYNKIN